MLLVSDTSILFITTCLTWLFVLSRRPSTPPLPPGPKKWPLIGSILKPPRQREWLKCTELAKQYGDLMSLSVLGQTVIIVSSAKTAAEFLDKKSRIHSDRPYVPMAQLAGWHHTLALLRYGPRFRKYRKIFHQVIGTNVAVGKFHDMSEMELRRFLKLLIDKPEDFLAHIKRMASSLILRITFGYKTRSGSDPFVSNADTAMGHLSSAASPGAFVVNYIPSLRHIPEWFPGTGFKRIAREWAKTLDGMVERPYELVKQEIANGTAEHSMVYELLKDGSKLSEDDIHDIKWAAQSSYAGGSDPTISIIYAFFKAMVLYPEVQSKAQAEIDGVIGNDRLPVTEDCKNLPYISAIVAETLRWHVVFPIGVFHRTVEDDVHDGYFIPKDSIIISNIWHMARDPEVYTNPDTFDPARFMPTEGREPEPDPRGFAFGFGRRICPGRLLADASVFATCAMVLAAFNITPHMENGEPVMPDTEQEPGAISHPSPFRCNIVPRSDKAIALIKGS